MYGSIFSSQVREAINYFRCSVLFFNVSKAFLFTGQVVSVLDGDTIEVLHDGKAQRIGLHGIDCQKKEQAFAKQRGMRTKIMSYYLQHLDLLLFPAPVYS